MNWSISGSLISYFFALCVAGMWVDAGLVQKLTQIRVLRFQFLIEDAPTDLDSISWMTAFLSTLPNPELLEELWISGLWLKRDLEGGDDDKESKEAYKNLVALLTSTKFENIRNLWIIPYEEDMKLSNEDAEQMFHQLLSGVYGAGRGCVQVRVLDGECHRRSGFTRF